MKTIDIKAPYLIFLGNETEITYAKTGAGLVQWRPELCKGQIRLAGGTFDLGLPEMTLIEAKDAGVKSLVIGTASVGGGTPEGWFQLLEKAAGLGMDIVAGVHAKLNDIEPLRLAADKGGANLIDIRVHPETMPIGSGKKRSGKRLLTVGIGKQVNPDIRCVGISVNTSTLPEEEREAHLNNLSAELCLPCVDPIAGDSKPIIDNLSGV